MNAWRNNHIRNIEDIQIQLNTPYPENKIYPEDIFFDYFCSGGTLRKRGKALLGFFMKIVDSPKIDKKNTELLFKNNAIDINRAQDDFRICDIKTGNVIYTVTPKIMDGEDKGKSAVYGRENEFMDPLVIGAWEDVEYYFMAGVANTEA